MSESPEELASLTLGRHLYPKFLRPWRVTVIPYSADERWRVFEDKVRQIYPGFHSGTLGLYRTAAESIGLIPPGVRKLAAERLRAISVRPAERTSPGKVGRILTGFWWSCRRPVIRMTSRGTSERLSALPSGQRSLPPAQG